MNTYDWYQTLVKPAWAPPAWVFGPVWMVLYAIIAFTFGAVFYRAARGQLSWRTALPFALNLVFNFAFTPIQFGLQNNFLAALDVLLVLATLVWALLAIWRATPKRSGESGPRLRWIALANIPYLLWVVFAAILQITITVLSG